MDARNELMHGSWHTRHYLDTGEVETKRVHLAKTGVRQMADVTIEQIEGVARTLETVIAKAQAMFVMLDNEIGPIAAASD